MLASAVLSSHGSRNHSSRCFHCTNNSWSSKHCILLYWERMHGTDSHVFSNGVTLVSEFVGVEMIYFNYFNFTMDKDATMVSVSLQPSQGLTKRSVNLSAGSCHSDLASERVSRILNMNLKIEAEWLSRGEGSLLLMRCRQSGARCADGTWQVRAECLPRDDACAQPGTQLSTSSSTVPSFSSTSSAFPIERFSGSWYSTLKRLSSTQWILARSASMRGSAADWSVLISGSMKL
jgi:hypothetical protein